MRINDLYPEVVTENLNYEFKAVLSSDNPIKWAKTIIAYANGNGGTIFIGVSNDGNAFGIDLDQIDKTKNLIALINNRFIFQPFHQRFSSYK